jgi:MoxR-like ATPase
LGGRGSTPACCAAAVVVINRTAASPAVHFILRIRSLLRSWPTKPRGRRGFSIIGEIGRGGRPLVGTGYPCVDHAHAEVDLEPLTLPASVDDLQAALGREQYVAERSLAVAIYLSLRLQRPLFLEGEAGVGKTEVAKVLAASLGTSLIRLQCYEGLDVGHAVYEWNYPRQILEIRMLEVELRLGEQPSPEGRHDALTRDLFQEAFLIKRPLLRAIEETRRRPPVLLIDEIDRADEEFEGYLLELLADFQITIPELGTIRAAAPPVVIITSNRTRDVHDALKRRCVYAWIEYPDFAKERRIVATKVPGISERLADQVTAFVQELRTADLYKASGVSETLDWANALVALNQASLVPDVVDDTLGLLLKNQEDIQQVRGDRTRAMLTRALARAVTQA